MIITDKVHTWIMRNEDALFEHQLELMKQDFPPEKLTEPFISKQKNLYLQYLKDKLEYMLKKNHSTITSKNRDLMRNAIKKTFNSDIAD